MQRLLVVLFSFLVCNYALPSYCPSENDLTVAYGIATLTNQGWQVGNGGGAVATKASFNLLGGSVSYNVNFGNTQGGVNGNIYTISPSSIPSSGFTNADYCDGQSGGTGWCLEVDWIESNGACLGASTLHTVAGSGSGCNSGGCQLAYSYNGSPSFSMKITYGTNGTWTTVHNGVTINPSNLSPQPSSSDWSIVQSSYQTHGAVIYSSLWTGWTPSLSSVSCASGGSLSASYFTISNLQITGTVVQGPTPTLCSGSSSPPPPPSSPPPPPSSPPPPPPSSPPPPPPSSPPPPPSPPSGNCQPTTTPISNTCVLFGTSSGPACPFADSSYGYTPSYSNSAVSLSITSSWNAYYLSCTPQASPSTCIKISPSSSSLSFQAYGGSESQNQIIQVILNSGTGTIGTTQQVTLTSNSWNTYNVALSKFGISATAISGVQLQAYSSQVNQAQVQFKDIQFTSASCGQTSSNGDLASPVVSSASLPLAAIIGIVVAVVVVLAVVVIAVVVFVSKKKPETL